MNWTGC